MILQVPDQQQAHHLACLDLSNRLQTLRVRIRMHGEGNGIFTIPDGWEMIKFLLGCGSIFRGDLFAVSFREVFLPMDSSWEIVLRHSHLRLWFPFLIEQWKKFNLSNLLDQQVIFIFFLRDGWRSWRFVDFSGNSNWATKPWHDMKHEILMASWRDSEIS